jgi:hypothetical protein
MFSCFALSDSFWALPRASRIVFKFCATGLVSGGTEDVGSRFHVLRSRTRFWRYRGRRFPFSCSALLDTFWAVPRASGLVYMFCAPGLVSGGTEDAGSRFQFLRSRTRFVRYRGRRLPFSCFALPDTFWAFYVGVGSRFHVMCSRTLFGCYRGRRVPFSCFELPDTFRAVPRAPVPVFMFCAPGHVSGGTEGAGSRFLVLCSRTRFGPYRGRRVLFT